MCLYLWVNLLYYRGTWMFIIIIAVIIWDVLCCILVRRITIMCICCMCFVWLYVILRWSNLSLYGKIMLEEKKVVYIFRNRYRLVTSDYFNGVLTLLHEMIVGKINTLSSKCSSYTRNVVNMVDSWWNW